MSPPPTEENAGPIWDPVAQIYVGGQVPENAQVQKMIAENGGTLRVFGYGSLCWKPGDGILANPRVSSLLGKARGYRRCWAQKSTDHRGTPDFPGLVCTLLKDEEVTQLRGKATTTATATAANAEEETLTEGVLYVVPKELVKECLQELDFREKGGYARDVIEVIEDETGKAVHALLYRGTPDNPAMWMRALRDLPYAAAILSVSEGPSGRNDEYLRKLNEFLEASADVTKLKKSDDTIDLAAMMNHYQASSHLYFLYGAGSNQHNQLLLKSDNNHNAARLVNGDQDAYCLSEMLLCVPKQSDDYDLPKRVFAGGGNSAVLTTNGRLYLFGWNDRGQCGCPTSQQQSTRFLAAPMYPPLDNLRVQQCALGFQHTLLIESETGHLWAMGENSRGQVDAIGGEKGSNNCTITTPVRVALLGNESVVDVDCGLYHSAAITADGQLVVFGCGRFGQSLSATDPPSMNRNSVWTGRWQPDDGGKLCKVACGRRHTMVLAEDGNVYSLGDNKYGQLGRPVSSTDNSSDSSNKRDSTPQPIHGPWKNDGFTVKDIHCGWSHALALAQKQKGTDNVDSPVETAVYGWGRCDKGQLGLGDESVEAVESARRLFEYHPVRIKQVMCGSEFTLIVDDNNDIWGCGWNEHGNLAQGHDRDRTTLVKLTGAQIGNPPLNPKDADLSVAAGGAHVVAMRVVPTNVH